MLERLYQLLGALIWRAILSFLVVLAIVVSAAGVLTPMLPSANSTVAEFIEDRTGLQILIGSLDGEMRGFRPRVKLQDVQIIGQLSDDATAVFGASSVELTVNLWRSLIQWQLVVAELSASNIDMPAAIDGVDRSIVIPFDPNVLATEIERIELDAMRVTLSRLSAPERRPLILDVHLGLQRVGSERRLRVVARDIAQNQLIVSGSGIGNPLQLGRFKGEFTGQLQARDLSPVTRFLGADVSGEGVANLWVEAAETGLEATISAELNDVAPAQSEGAIDQLTLIGAGSFDGSSSVFHLATLNMVEEGSEFAISPMSLAIDEKNLEFRSKALDLRVLARLGRILEPADTERMALLSGLAPVGLVQDVVVEEQLETGERKIDFRFDGLGWTAHAAIPGAGNLSGRAVINGRQAQVALQSSDLVIDIPTRYPQPIALNALTGEFGLDWSNETLQLHGGRAIADADTYSARLLVSAHLPIDATDQNFPKVFLSMASDRVPVADMQALVPQGIDPEVYQWIQHSVVGGYGSEAAMIWRGSLLPKDIRRRSIQIATEFEIDSIEMLPSLPRASAIEGRLVLDNGLVTVIGNRAMLAELSVSETLVQVGKKEGKSILVSDSTISGKAGQAMTQLGELAFIEPSVQTLIQRTDVDGEISADLTVRRLLKDRVTPADISVAVHLNEVSVIDKPSGIRGDQWTGGFTYHQSRGVVAGQMDGNLMGGAARVIFNRPKNGDQLDLSLETRFSVDEWRGHLNHPLFMEIEGETDVHIGLRANKAIDLMATSSLEGIELDLPFPLGKRAAETASINIGLQRSETINADIEWSGRLRANYKSNEEDWSLLVEGGDYPIASPIEIPPLHREKKITLSGGYTDLDVAPWISFFSTQFPNSSASNGFDLEVVDFGLPNASFGAISLGDMFLNGEIGSNRLQMTLDSQWLRGLIDRRKDQEVIRLEVSKLDLDFISSILGQSDSNSDSVPVAIGRLPSTRVVANNIHWKQRNIGGVSFSATSEQEGFLLSSMSGTLAGFTLNDGTELEWSVDGNGHEQTQLRFVATLDEPEQFFSLFSAEPVMRLSRGDVDTDLAWSGSPKDFGLQSVSGVASLQFADGSFLPVSSDATGALRFISLFNLAGLVQRSNVNQLFDSGLTFDRANGDIAFDHGVLSVNGFSVRNSGGSLNLVGALDTNRETIDGELSVTLPLVENIPWVAALAGGLPVAAGAYLASKIFEDQVNRLSSGVYVVTGDIAQPNVRFVRVFDAKAGASSQGSVISESDRK